LPNEFSINSGELTPTLKLKRKFITQKYQEIITGFYSAE
jgi:long-chain acyl-CoA synthetase